MYEIDDTQDINTPSPQCIGLSKSDAERIDPAKIIKNQEGVSVLVDTSELYWYSQPVVAELSGGSKAYLYTHESTSQETTEIVRKVVEGGDTVLINTDGSGFDKSVPLIDSFSYDAGVVVQEVEGVFQNQYVGVVAIEGCEGFESTESFVDVYNTGDDFKEEQKTGTYSALLGELPDEAIQRMWDIYNSRFQDVSKISITEASFDEASFRAIMKDPSVIKPVHVVDGKITNLMMFMTDLSSASWLNESYFAEKYPDAYQSKNIMLFLGIVSDPSAEPNQSLASIHQLVKVCQRRGSNVIITFECNEVSANYLPKIVEYGINSSGAAVVEGLDAEVSQSRYVSLQKSD